MNQPEPLGRHCRKNEESIPRISGNIIRCIRDAEAPLILAPGDAKIEFKKRL